MPGKDRNVVYLTPWTALVCVLVLLISLGWLNRDLLQGLHPKFSKESSDSLAGEWVGIIHINGVRDPFLRDIQKQAAIQFNLSVTDSIAKKYGGNGKLTVSGEPERAIQITDLWPSRQNGVKDFKAGLWLLPYKQGDKADLISGGFDGTFEPGKLLLQRKDDLGYSMSGELQKGADADYERLLKQISARP